MKRLNQNTSLISPRGHQCNDVLHLFRLDGLIQVGDFNMHLRTYSIVLFLVVVR